jgi:REP element-mobilizing transposase RayT
MTGYRRNFIPGGCFFFTVNLADRRSRLLTENVEALRAAFRETGQRHPSRPTRSSCCQIIYMRSGRCLRVIGILRCAGG